jgi:hypothetical protein
MMKSSIDKIIQQIQESLEESLQEYVNKPVDDNLDAIKSQVTSFLQSVMYEEEYDSREHIKVKVEQDITDPSKVSVTLVPLSVGGFDLIRRLEVENGKHSNI